MSRTCHPSKESEALLARPDRNTRQASFESLAVQQKDVTRCFRVFFSVSRALSKLFQSAHDWRGVALAERSSKGASPCCGGGGHGASSTQSRILNSRSVGAEYDCTSRPREVRAGAAKRNPVQGRRLAMAHLVAEDVPRPRTTPSHNPLPWHPAVPAGRVSGTA